ncbi:hypothetical protein [Lysobacter sp. cf310]|uniref:hypothetical protein n=1 Tax=Lysobacter sp. cf310 TaxID=1761790 RepID=UPI00111412CB|nr:hypothetical protein [Lysobacter sp. cf310]
MRLPLYFIFLPTSALVAAALQVNEAGMAKAWVWTTHEHDRTGSDHSQQELEQAFWADFQANLIYDDETEAQKSFRNFCVQLGFSGCWTVVQTGWGGPAEDLIESGCKAMDFLRSHSSVDPGVA